MHRRQALKVFTGLALCPLCAATSFGEEIHAGPHWRYEGATGPDKWGSLNAANGMCSRGTQQSPVDLVRPVSARQPRLEIRWNKRPDTIVNNGHSIQLNFAEGNMLKVGGRSYALKQFHFHHPSEHLVDGKVFAMEAHFVHAAAYGGLAVVGVFMAPGGANAVFNKIVSTVPAEGGPARPRRSRHRSQRLAAGPAGLLPLRGVTDAAAVQ